MPKKITEKIQKKPYIKCKKCGDVIFYNTHKKMIYCKCKSIAVDGCEDYVRINGERENYEEILK